MGEALSGLKRSLMCGEVRESNVSQKITLMGWVQRNRKLGGLQFIDLRDRTGIMQIVFGEEINAEAFEKAKDVRPEYCIAVTGEVVLREAPNHNMPTGLVELKCESLKVLSESETPPIYIKEGLDAAENIRLKYRYLDLRRPDMQRIFMIRSKISKAVRDYLDANNFLEVETPILTKSTPEGARDYLVPSRNYPGMFYALPQSPQIFKQLLMVSGFDRYYQIAKCFRDEDLRADRQPEFTQVDVECSFVDENDIMSLGEKLIASVFKEVKNIDVQLPLIRMKYDEAISKYGSDKPDLRFGMEIIDITNIFENTEFGVFKGVLANDGVINAIVVKNSADKYSRKDLDKLTDYVKNYKASGLAYLKFNEEVSGSIVKVISDQELMKLKESLKVENNDLVLIVSGNYKIVKTSLGALRCKIAKDLDLIKKDDYKLLWVVDFPSFEWSDEENRYMACHHPFTMPKDNDVDKLLTDKEHCYSKAYDIVINGYEAGGGSIRIHDEEVQKKMFQALELSQEDIDEKFGFFVEALKYGCPPHGGFALGLDRLVMILANTENIRDVIAFPKTASASDLMSECPNKVSESQLKELGLHIKVD